MSIKWAIDELKSRSSTYKLYRDYMNGQHRLDFVPADFRSEFANLIRSMRLNLCPAVVTSVRDRLKLSGLTTDENDTDTNSTLSEIWRRNRMELRSNQVHTDALACGDSFAIVWPNEMGEAVIYPNQPEMVVVKYSEDNPDEIIEAAKWWIQDDKRGRLTLYFPDRIEKYITRNEIRNGDLNASNFMDLDGEAAQREGGPVISNQYGQVPVFHFQNDDGSELKEAIPIQDGLNKTARDIIIGVEQHALPQRWATGVQVRFDTTTGKPINDWTPGDMWTSGNPEARYGQLEAANLSQIKEIAKFFIDSLAMVTGIPPPSIHVQRRHASQW